MTGCCYMLESTVCCRQDNQVELVWTMILSQKLKCLDKITRWRMMTVVIMILILMTLHRNKISFGCIWHTPTTFTTFRASMNTLIGWYEIWYFQTWIPCYTMFCFDVTLLNAFRLKSCWLLELILSIMLFHWLNWKFCHTNTNQSHMVWLKFEAQSSF